ncbi:MAG: TorD/DmsD family molecular chaperone [Nitrospirota bacterium]
MEPLKFVNFKNLERAALYRLFAELFIKSPKGETLQQVKELLHIASDETPDEIRMDFVYIFSDVHPHLHPYESFYHSLFNYTLRVPGVSSDIAGNVQSFYQAAGLMLHEAATLSADHISAELLFMSYLVENNLVEHQRDFFKVHLSKWIPGYCEEVSKHASTMFYKEIARTLKEFILAEGEHFGIQGLPDGTGAGSTGDFGGGV